MGIPIKDVFIHDHVDITLVEYEDHLHLELIEITKKNKGLGKKAMSSIVNVSNKLKKPIVLLASSELDSDINRLIRFYIRFGFVLGRLDLNDKHNMYYIPS